jgi:hypothetical protein
VGEGVRGQGAHPHHGPSLITLLIRRFGLLTRTRWACCSVRADRHTLPNISLKTKEKKIGQRESTENILYR